MIKINSKQYENTEVIKVEIDDKVYSLPLIKYLPYKKVKQLIAVSEDRNFDIAIDAMSDYIPRKVLESLTVNNLLEIFKSWNGASDTEDKAEEKLGK